MFPCAKINLGLNITAKREDGFHDLETICYPLPLTDALEIKYMGDEFPSDVPCDLKVTGNAVDCNEEDNLVIRAYNLLAKDYKLPRVHAHLYKHIPMQAGLGGGSSDAAFMIKLLDERFRLNIGNAEMERYAAKLGSDCAFFITCEPSFAQGKGEILEPADAPKGNLKGYWLVLVKPAVAVSTKEAYANITPKKPKKCCRDVVHQPIETWKEDLVNDFEESVFKNHPQLAEIKNKLYALGAAYASMSGSGSSLYGIFKEKPTFGKEEFSEDCFFDVMKL
jgi:4-diphosphocytidyl-2-C-methyl-D-erythritol kinase